MLPFKSFFLPESVITNDESRPRTERNRSAIVRDDATNVICQRFTCNLALTWKFHPQDRVFSGVDGTAVHLNGTPDPGDDGRADVGDGWGALGLTH